MRRNLVDMSATTAAPSSRHYDTLILGAGMSGLSCAARLFQHQYYKEKDRLLVLEARERIGGRIGSVHVNGCRLDTGANWIHGVGTKDKPNPLMSLLPHKRYKQVSGTVVFQAPPGDDVTVGSTVKDADHGDGDWVKVQPIQPAQSTRSEGSGGRVIPTSVAETLMLSIWSMIGSLRELAAQDSEKKAKHTTMLQAIAQTDEFGEAYQRVPPEYHHSLSGIPQFIESMEAAPLAAQSAEHPRDQPGMSLLEFGIDDFEGDQVFLQDGYTAVVDEVARGLTDAGLIQLGTEVTQIDWSRNPVKVETSYGTTYTARQVVCTLPLGVLQHYTQEPAPVPGTSAPALFQPPLPSDKQTAIQSLGFGTLDKIMLVYRTPWWTEQPYISILKKGLVRQPFAIDEEPSSSSSSRNGDDSGLPPDSFIGFTAELPGIEIHQDGTSSSGLRVLSIINLHNLTGYPVLSAFVSCANAAGIVESMTDEQAGGVVHRALVDWLGREPPRPDAVHVTRWARDEFSRGSYSHMITGLSETRHREVFQQPVVNGEGGVLRFAGEHTSRDHFATVHGALLSGWREADAILNSAGKVMA
ncbi:Lysine-specific histone demethylase 1A [Cytospora mali]|uniref:Lysine-specific histone demethylase 1A n=1 Tax=Cytospora mali TaxID=578113 RepID=A0A194VAD1_CYTMA|nr:Lysine-specific histone demethylase 1A [Valsa mali var. pyri (nom. inval.)]